MARALGRVGTGTYLRHSSLDFASPSAAARELARHRWGVSQPGPVTHQPNCGASDDLGYCAEPYHAAGCGSLATTETAEALRASGAYARLASHPFTDAENRIWADQHSRPMTLAGHIEAASGQRLGGTAAFETGGPKREVTTPQPWPVLRDPDDPGDPGRTLPDVSHITAAMGIASPSAQDARDRAMERQGQMLADAVLHGGFRAAHPRLRGEPAGACRAAAPARAARPSRGDLGRLPSAIHGGVSDERAA